MSAPISTITENGTITSGIVLTSPSYTNPVTIVAGAHISFMAQASYQYYAVNAATAWTVQNDGTIDASGDGLYNKAGYPYGGGGIALTNGGVVINAASGLLEAYSGSDVIKISGAAGTVLNQGVIDAAGYGISLLAGGSIDNAAGATLSSRLANYVEGADDVVTNEGTIVVSDSQALAVVDTGTYALVVNAAGGFIDGVAGYGIGLVGDGTVTNQGTVLASGAGINVGEFQAFYSTGTVNNSGFIYGSIGIAGQAGATTGPDIINNAAGGTIGGTLFAVDMGNGVTLTNYGAIVSKAGDGIYLQVGGTVINAGSISGGKDAVQVTGGNLLFEVEQGSTINGDVVAFSGGGNLTNNILDLAASAGTAALGTSFQNFNTIEIAPGTAWLLEGGSAAVAGGQTFAGFAASDTLDLTGVTFTAGETSAYTELSLGGPSYGYLAITNASGTYDINFSGLGGNPSFTLSSDGHGGTDIVVGAVTCFCRGTLIRTARGEVAVETLAIGDLVATVAGVMQPVKWIGRRAYDGRMIAKNHLALPVCIKAGAILPGSPARDLYVSPGHGIFVNGILVPAWRLVNGVSVTQAVAVEQVEYFHVELERHEVILAENCAVESFQEQEEYGLRALFQNVAEFHALYPGAAPDGPALPRADHGWQLQMAYRLLAARAGVAAPAAQGPLRGFVDQDGPHIVSGWAQDCDAPEEPVALDILLNGTRIANVLADIYRPDLRVAGLGSGCHGFVFACAADVTGDFEVRRSSDGAVLAVPGTLARTRQAQAA